MDVERLLRAAALALLAIWAAELVGFGLLWWRYSCDQPNRDTSTEGRRADHASSSRPHTRPHEGA
jgi:hypothetical protein